MADAPSEITVEALVAEILSGGARCALQVRHAERPKMDPGDPAFGETLELTAEGARTAEALGKKLGALRDGVSFRSSPLRRTMMTAELIARGMGLGGAKVSADPELGNGTFYFTSNAEAYETFRHGFFEACFEYFRKGSLPGLRNIAEASDALEAWLLARLDTRLLVAVTHDSHIAAFLAAKAGIAFTRENWPRFLDGAALLAYPDGSKRFALVRTGLSKGICGVDAPSA